MRRLDVTQRLFCLGFSILAISCASDFQDPMGSGPTVGDGAATESVGQTRQALGGWMPTFWEEFDGTSLNRNNWQPMNMAAGTFNGEWQRYEDDEGPNGTFDVSGGVLRIYMRWAGGGFDGYRSARIVSKNKVERSQGAWEARIKFWKSGVAKGLWPAVWFLGHRISQPPFLHADENVCWPRYPATEIDLFESIVNQGVNQGNFIKEINGSGCEVYPGGLVTDYTESIYDWNTYRLEYSNNYARLLVNGVQKRAVPEADWRGAWDDKLFVLMNVAIGGVLGEQGGGVDFGPNDTAGMAVDSIKHYAWEDTTNFPSSSDTYELRSMIDNYILTAKDGSGNNNRATMHLDSNWSSQQWQFVSAGGGYYYIRSTWSGKEIEMKDEYGNWNSPPFNVTMASPAAVGSHKFMPVEDSSGKYYLKNEYGHFLTSKDAGGNWNSLYRRASGQTYDTVDSRRWIIKRL